MSKTEKARAPGPRPARPSPAAAGTAVAPITSQRIAKAMARAGLCSRREAETWIADGRVTINGEVCATPAVNVGPLDAVLVDGAPLPLPDKTRLYLFHKPRGLVTSDRDPEGRRTITDFLRETWPSGPRVVTIGRLDINTEGLLLLTNDGGLARVLELPETGWLRRYRVRAKGAPDQVKLDALARGISIDGIAYAGIEAKIDRMQGANCWLTMGLREGKNREIKRVLEHLGLEVNRLIRLSFGPFQLLELTEGAVEEVPTRVLRDQLGETLAAKAGAFFEVEGKGHSFAEETPLRSPAEQVGRRETPNRRSEHRRTDRRKADPVNEARPRPERPAAAKRKHISTMREERSEQRETGTRVRIDRSQTADRRQRVIQVERLRHEDRDGARARAGAKRHLATPRPVGAPAAMSPRGASDRDDAGQRWTEDRPRQKSGAKLSPSAAGKRKRIARSGGERRAGTQEGPALLAEATSRKPRDASSRVRPAALRYAKRGDSKRGSKKPTVAKVRSNSPVRPAKGSTDRGPRRPRPKS